MPAGISSGCEERGWRTISVAPINVAGSASKPPNRVSETIIAPASRLRSRAPPDSAAFVKAGSSQIITPIGVAQAATTYAAAYNAIDAIGDAVTVQICCAGSARPSPTHNVVT